MKVNIYRDQNKIEISLRKKSSIYIIHCLDAFGINMYIIYIYICNLHVYMCVRAHIHLLLYTYEYMYMHVDDRTHVCAIKGQNGTHTRTVESIAACCAEFRRQAVVKIDSQTG